MKISLSESNMDDKFQLINYCSIESRLEKRRENCSTVVQSCMNYILILDLNLNSTSTTL